MNIDKYKTFLACVKSRTFYDAADSLCLTASTVSKHISALENELGVLLFERTPKGLVLTAAGAKRIPIIQQLVSAYDRLMLISDEITPQETFKICSVPLFARFHVGQMLDDFAAVYSDYPVEIAEMSHPRKLLEKHEFELAFLRGPTLDPNSFDRIEFTLGHMGIVVRSSNPLAQRVSVALSELRDITFVGPDVDIYHTLYTMIFDKVDYTPKINYLLPREDSVMIDVRNCNSIGLLSSEIYSVYQLEDTSFVPFSDQQLSLGELVRLRNVPLSTPGEVFWNFAENWLVQNRNATLFYGD